MAEHSQPMPNGAKAPAVLIVAPGNGITGGPEALHQLVHQARACGINAAICYWPTNRRFDCPEPYRKYNAPQAQYADNSETLVVFPENMTAMTAQVRHARCAVWWLSVDNYLGFPQNRRFFGLWLARNIRPWVWQKTMKRMRRQKMRPLSQMCGLVHYAQSEYARRFLADKGINAPMLGDYLNSEHFRPWDSAQKQNIIAYNPAKGANITKRLIHRFPALTFKPMQNMTTAQVADFLRTAKVYVDFGNHPGKDRPPREALMAGCCIIAGGAGSSGNAEDMPMPEEFRIKPEGGGDSTQNLKPP